MAHQPVDVSFSAAHAKVIGGSGNSRDPDLGPGFRWRRCFCREGPGWNTPDPQSTKRVENYEAGIPMRGPINCDETPLRAVDALAAKR